MQQSIKASSSVLSAYDGVFLSRCVHTEVQLGSMLHLVIQSGCFTMYLPNSSFAL